MDPVSVGETRLHIARWIEEGQSVLGVLPGLFDEHERLRTAVEMAERECARLREELGSLRSENDALRADREEIAESIAEGLNRIMNEALQRLRAPLKPPGTFRHEPTYS